MSIAQMIDHTLLRADAVKDEITKLTEEAARYQFASVCVNPAWVAYCAEQLAGTPVKVCTVIGFPLGASTTAVKAYETADAIANGADEIDMVINVGQLKAGNDDEVERDIAAVVTAAAGKALVKVIIETCLLTEEEKVRACEPGGEGRRRLREDIDRLLYGRSYAEDVALMRRTVGERAGVKASGGVRSLEDVNTMIEAGATRIGASSGVSIMNGMESSSSY